MDTVLISQQEGGREGGWLVVESGRSAEFAISEKGADTPEELSKVAGWSYRADVFVASFALRRTCTSLAKIDNGGRSYNEVLKAREVLGDCRVAWSELEVETRPEVFRVLWVAGVALARAVGHILHKVDAKQDVGTENAVKAAYTAWQENRLENAIFWDFIEQERNQILKQYEMGFLPGPVAVLAANELFTLDDNLFCPIADGPFAGEDCRDVLEMAISWWDTQLSRVENSIKRHEVDSKRQRGDDSGNT